MQKRTLFTLFLIPVVILIISIEKGNFLTLFIILQIVNLFVNLELYHLIKRKNIKCFLYLNILLSIVVLTGFYIYSINGSINLLCLLLIIPYLIIGARIVLSNLIENSMSTFSVNILSIFYSSVLPGFILLIRNLNDGFYLLTTFFFIIWMGDMGAYIIGSLFGEKRHKIPFTASPNKSWEGIAASFIFSIIGGGILSNLLFSSNLYIDIGILNIAFRTSALSIKTIIFVSIIINIAAQIGDLFESALKRNAKIKDSNFLLTIPGHGGFLDRLDSTLFSAPLFYFIVKLIIK